MKVRERIARIIDPFAWDERHAFGTMSSLERADEILDLPGIGDWPNWQQIETAPRGGKPILTFTERGHTYRLAAWIESRTRAGFYVVDAVASNGTAHASSEPCNPDWWMPLRLPAPPHEGVISLL